MTAKRNSRNEEGIMEVAGVGTDGDALAVRDVPFRGLRPADGVQDNCLPA